MYHSNPQQVGIKKYKIKDRRKMIYLKNLHCGHSDQYEIYIKCGVISPRTV